VTDQSKYNPITPEIAEELKQIVGERHVIYGDTEKLEPCSHDEVPDRRYAHMPEAVVRPASAAEIAAVVKLANRELIPVTPRGAGSGLSGGAVPVHGGIVLLTDRMNRILEIDCENMMMVVEPGVVTNEINEALEEYGLFYAGYPMSLETCFIGGNVAENAGGAKTVRYGVTGQYVLGLELVTPTGEIVHLGGKRVKDVTGYNLIQLMVGSEGTLGIFTRIILRLMPLPNPTVDLLCLFRSPEDAIAAVPRIMAASSVAPVAIEFMDRAAVRAACDYLNETIPYQQAGAMLLISVDGPDDRQLERAYDAVGELALGCGAIEVYVADNLTTSERLWRVRRNIAEACNAITEHQSNEDIVVPPAAIPALIAALQNIAQRYDVTIPCYGHAADGNVHARIVMNPHWPLQRWHDTLSEILKELYRTTAELGGTLSGEHGIGHKRKDYLAMFLSEPTLEIMRAVKRALDPNNILNPGKILNL
jgi:glycolate oxidase